MASEQFSYNGSTTLSQACGLSDLTVTVNNASATGLPTIPNFRIKIDAEEMLVTAVNLGTDVYTVTRAIEGTTQATHANGAPVIANLTPAALTTAFQRIDQGVNNALSGRFVGQFTFSGAPTSGTWQLNDYGYDSNGVLYLNVSAGTPGTWRAISGWLKWSRYIVGAGGAPDTTTNPGGDIVMPSGFTHAKIIWRARDTSASTVGTFGGMQIAVAGGAIDQAGHYSWSDDSSMSNPITAGFDGGTNQAYMAAIVTQGGGDGSSFSGQFATGEIDLPFYTYVSRPTFTWRMAQANPGNQIGRTGSGVYWALEGPVTKVRFFSNSANLAALTTFDLLVSP